MRGFNKYLLHLKFKKLGLRYSYHCYFFITQNKLSKVYAFCRLLSLQGLEFLYVKHSRYLISPKLLKYFVSGSYLIVYSNSIDKINNLTSPFLQIMAFSINMYFISNLYLENIQNWYKFSNGNFWMLLAYLKYFFFVYGYILIYIKLLLIRYIQILRIMFLSSNRINEINFNK